MKVVLIGRPNVGKSTLFNRLAREKFAIVGNSPGTTRDRKFTKVDLCGLEFDLLDTPGVDPFSKDSIAISMNAQSLAGIEESDVVFFIIDATDGITEYDKEIAFWIRSSFKKTGNRSVVVIANKSDAKHLPHHSEILGFGESIAISAEHNLGIEEIYSVLLKYQSESESAEKKSATPQSQIKVAIVGRPNVGKSTLINAIIGENRLLTGEESGITRDAISIDWKFKNHHFLLIDTAGQSRKSGKVDEKIETISVIDAWKHIRQAHVVIVVMDIGNPWEKQDITIARKAFNEGKIIIFAINKSDTVGDPQRILKSVEERATKEFAQLPGVACLLVSAKEKKGLARIFNTSMKLFDNWSRRIPTSILNRWFHMAIEQNPPPLINGLPIKLKYISQTNTKPPTFTAFANRSKHFPVSYERYLLNNLRKSFEFKGIPLRLFIRQ